MNNGAKSAIVRLWNLTRNEHDIADKLNLEFTDVCAFLRTRQGYPDGLIKRKCGGFSTRLARRVDGARYGQHGPEPKVSLPKLKFLGE